MNTKQRARPYTQFSEYKAEIPLARELPYWDFMDDLTVLGDGSLALGFRLRGLSIETWDVDQVNRLTGGLRAMLNSLPDGCEISFLSELNSDFAETINAHERLRSKNSWVAWVGDGRIERLKAEAESGGLLRPTLYAFVYRRFELLGKAGPGRLLKSFFATPKKFQAIKKNEHDTAERDLRQVAENLRERLEANGLSVEAISGDNLWTLLFRFLNPKRAKNTDAPRLNATHREQEFAPDELVRVKALALPSPREQLVFSDLVQGYDAFFMDGVYHRVLTLKTLPEYTHSGLVSRLMQLPFPQLLHVHVQVPEQSKELASLQARRRMAHSMSATQGGRASDLESEARLQSTEELLRELINTGQKIYYFQLAVLLRAESVDELDARTKTVLATIRELNGAEGLAETVAGFKVWKTLLPAGNIGAVRLKRVKTDNLADFLPLYEPYSGPREKDAKPVCLFRNRQQGLVSYDPFDSRLPNYNALVTGSSGAGKSFLNNLVLLQYVSQNPLTYIIDIGGSYRKLCEFLGGQYIEISPPRAGEACRVINPFELAPGQVEPSPQKIKFLLALLENVLTDTDGEKLPKLDKSLLEESVLALYKKNGDRTPRLSELNSALAQSKDERLRQFSRMLYPWTGDRPYGRLLDGENGLDLHSDVVVFDLKGLSSYPDLQSVMILIITDFILGRVESKDDAIQGRRKQILMDECWELLKSQASSNFMEYCVRTLRKTGSGITFITQGLEEIVASSIGSAILSNTATKFILMQRGDLEPIRKILKLNDQEMALISSLRQAKGKYSEAFLMANDARTVIRACPTPVEYWLATSDASDNALLADTRVAFPEKDLAQVIHWLADNYPNGSQGLTKVPGDKIQMKE
ncbi:MAG: TraC family protein [Deltaproteobacteria bacterium]|nr:TraC family protein [Deltaproteobacteria bacterium]